MFLFSVNKTADAGPASVSRAQSITEGGCDLVIPLRLWDLSVSEMITVKYAGVPSSAPTVISTWTLSASAWEVTKAHTFHFHIHFHVCVCLWDFCDVVCVPGVGLRCVSLGCCVRILVCV